ncbi:MAG TPA: lipopolysaccharide heptosyltransferase II [Ktedonobacteraceae bacterium]|nr:lipopolysaccharide heptosyltransferase II [Ktedonobacteraceae bacterium]
MTVLLQQRDEYGYLQRPDSRRKLRNRVVHSCKSVLLGGITLAMLLPGAWLRFSGLLHAHPALKPPQFQPRRLLVIRPDLIGDLVMTLAAVQALKKTYPDAEIDVVATPGSAKVVAGHPALHEVIAYDPNIWRRPKALLRGQNWRDARALRQRLRARQYDLAICVHGTWSGILGALSGAPRRIGFAKEHYAGFLTDPVSGGHWQPGDQIHEVDYCLQLAHAAGALVTSEDRVPHLVVPQPACQEVEALLAQAGVRVDKALIACHVCSNNGQSKRWPVPYWARLIDRLVSEDVAEVVLTGAPDDLPFVEEVIKRTHVKTINLAGKTSLLQLAALLQRATLMITGDSGPMHIGAAVGVPLLAMYGPTDPAQSGPVSPNATVLRDTIWCSPCYRAQGPADCRFFTTQCMKNIAPERVYAMVLEKLQEQNILAAQ